MRHLTPPDGRSSTAWVWTTHGQDRARTPCHSVLISILPVGDSSPLTIASGGYLTAIECTEATCWTGQCCCARTRLSSPCLSLDPRRRTSLLARRSRVDGLSRVNDPVRFHAQCKIYMLSSRKLCFTSTKITAAVPPWDSLPALRSATIFLPGSA